MRVITLAVAVGATLASAFVVPEPADSVETSAVSHFGKELAVEAASAIFSCAGSSQCGHFPGMIGYCDQAVNTMLPGLMFDTSGGRTGNCWGAPSGLGCGVFVAGPPGCYRSTEQMQAAYRNIRANGCRICGYVQDDDNRGDACQIKIDYVSRCDNHW
ncbi:hypothetical protein ALT_3364 [Aspergillus lentulus]|uniref:Uncharacterized protein n=1 Tax=Aspergillus lentulus TaxID=293939 RepID=A0AAN4PGS0_ASPLE|nr:hypothetical protein CNMCM6069_002991 [Aspergillus lentulus]KAF4171547.1 hypothetical protein CNMCM8060_002816 [Aspergillus lentulus]KAF4183539.1 hypothetical protein CNMCM7927_009016 [Aspergillus lentulus]KAF4189744.1 hypothetical protein CNMCM8694_003948 [Aspergillus lentulus]GAQ06043.1 hypothetical protein ALT_3364 [Aspergillus lentulus]